MICLDESVVEKLSSKGLLAYVAVKRAGDTYATTAELANLVKASTASMLEGLKELEAADPQAVTAVKVYKKPRWRCGIGGGGGGPVQLLESTSRYRDLVDDLKKYWDHMNKAAAFPFTGPDGVAVRQFLAEHPGWTSVEWRKALRNRAMSVRLGNASASEGICRWVRRLGDYLAGPLNAYNKPVEGSGNAGKAIALEHSINAAAAAYLARA